MDFETFELAAACGGEFPRGHRVAGAPCDHGSRDARRRPVRRPVGRRFNGSTSSPALRRRGHRRAGFARAAARRHCRGVVDDLRRAFGQWRAYRRDFEIPWLCGGINGKTTKELIAAVLRFHTEERGQFQHDVGCRRPCCDSEPPLRGPRRAPIILRAGALVR
jgi:hypothetical protein